MENNKYIKLFQSIRLEENKKATQLIKEMLIDFKTQHFSFNTALNSIIEHFVELQKENITSHLDLEFLLDLFEKGKGKFEHGKTYLVIPHILEPEFEKIEGLNISFEEYLTQLAKRISYTRTMSKFQSNDRLYEAMYKIGKFEGYLNLPDFDIRMFKYEPNYYDLEQEIFALAYPKSDQEFKIAADNEETNNNILPGNTLFKFHGKYLGSMQNETIFKAIKADYFHPNTSFQDYLNVFFKKPEEHKSIIQLGCKTKTFAKLLDEFKENIALTVNFTNIAKSKLFITNITQKPLNRGNISNALSKSTDLDKKAAHLIISAVKKLTESVKKSDTQ